MAFVVNEDTAAAIQKLSVDRRLARSKIAVYSGGMEGAATYLAENQTPQLVIVEATESGDALVAALGELAQVCDAEAKVILIGDSNDITLYKRLMAVGLSEYFPSGVTTEELIATVENFYSTDDTAGLGRTIAFVGARGGVGSSSVAANTAYCLANQVEEEVILLDLDLVFGTAALAFNMQPTQSIADALAQPDRLDDVLMERFMGKYGDHLSVVAAPVDLAGGSEIDPHAFETLIDLVSRMASYVVVDVPHQWVPWVSEVLLMANEVVVTVHADLANLRDAKNIFDVLSSSRGVDAPNRLVFNAVGASKKVELSPKDFEEVVGVSPSAQIPYNPALFGAAMNNGEMAVQISKGSKVSQEFADLARVVGARAPVTKARSSRSLFRRAK